MKNISAQLEHQFIGSEPKWNDPKMTIPKALSWYANQYGPKESKKYTLDYLKANKFDKSYITQISNVDDYRFCNLGFVCRIVMNGAPNIDINWIDKRLGNLKQLSDAPKKESQFANKEERITIQDKIYIQCNSFISEIEDFVDIFIKTKKPVDFNPYEWMINKSIKAVHAKQISEHFTPMQDEINQVITKQDKDLVEGYSNFSKPQIKQFYDLITSIIDDCYKIINNTKVIKKTRKKKAIPLEKKVAGLKFKKDDTETKLVSVNPVDIIGAKQLWVYNIKLKKLGVYHSKDDGGLVVKGSTLLDFDEVLSVQKTLRKPLDILPIVVKGKKTELRKLMNSITTKDSPLTGRINSDTILVKVVK